VRRPLVALAFLALCAGCGSQRGTLERLWHASKQAVVLIPGTSDYAPGDVRVSFLVVTNRGKAVETPTADVWVARSRTDVPFTHTVAHLERIGVPGGEGAADVTRIYVAHVRIRRPGTYWLVARPVGGSVRISGIRDLAVRARSATPAVGAPAIPSRTPTLATAPISKLTTRVPPDRALLRYSVAGSLRAHVPFLLAFATPRYCTSRTCGPVVDVVDSVRRSFAHSRIRFIHVEIYRNNEPSKGENQWVRQWQLPSEPWIFLVGADGRIKGKFEGALSRGELATAARRDLLSSTG
jgi:hypothetical protein